MRDGHVELVSGEQIGQWADEAFNFAKPDSQITAGAGQSPTMNQHWNLQEDR